jgi:sterol desaturase/sphingolipid hydroxylase (fatty acid hydroxylase superfamily)
MDASAEPLLAYTGIAIAAWFTLLFLAERLAPAAPRRDVPPGSRWNWLGDPRRLARNGVFWIVNAALGPLIVIPVTVWAAAHGLGWRPWSGWAGFALDLLVLDLWIYLWHRANHRIPFLWRFHGVHHLDRFLDTTTAGRFHVGEVALSALVRAVPIVVLGMTLEAAVAFEALVLAAALFHHSNVRLPARVEHALSWLVVTPSIHWVHHHAVRRDTDSNYATVLSAWDHLFRSRAKTRRVPDMDIGTEGAQEQTLGRLLLRPFRARTSG